MVNTYFTSSMLLRESHNKGKYIWMMKIDFNENFKLVSIIIEFHIYLFSFPSCIWNFLLARTLYSDFHVLHHGAKETSPHFVFKTWLNSEIV